MSTLLNELKGSFNNSLSDIYLYLAKYGCKIEDIKVNNDDSDELMNITFFISVPESSYLYLDDGKEASKNNVAEWAKNFICQKYDDTIFNGLLLILPNENQILDYMKNDYRNCSQKISVKYKVRDQYWSREEEEKYTMRTLLIVSTATKAIKKFEEEK